MGPDAFAVEAAVAEHRALWPYKWDEHIQCISYETEKHAFAAKAHQLLTLFNWLCMPTAFYVGIALTASNIKTEIAERMYGKRVPGASDAGAAAAPASCAFFLCFFS